MPAKLVSVNVTLGPAAAKAAPATLAHLKKAGLRNANMLEAVGIVTGTVAPEKLKALSRVPGVTVEHSETVSIPPPDSPIQ